jgi:hypothetical protein
MFQDFVCIKNNEIEKFLKENAVDFVRKCQAITYVIFEIFYFLDKNIIDIQNSCGGVVEFLESENNSKLIDMYQNKGFRVFNIRQSSGSGERKLVQMYRLI